MSNQSYISPFPKISFFCYLSNTQKNKIVFFFFFFKRYKYIYLLLYSIYYYYTKHTGKGDGSIILYDEKQLRAGSSGNTKTSAFKGKATAHRIFTAHPGPITSLCIHKDMLVTCGESKKIRRRIIDGKYSSEGAAREWSTVVIVIVIFIS